MLKVVCDRMQQPSALAFRLPPSRGLLGHLLIENERSRRLRPVLGMDNVVASSRRISVLVKATLNLHDLQR